MRLKRFCLVVLLIVGLWLPTNLKAPLAPAPRPCGIFPTEVSKVGEAFIKEHEAFRATAYQDSADVWTIGYGFTRWKGTKVTETNPGRVTRAQADAEFTRQLDTYEGIVRESVCSLFTQGSYDSLVSVAWNLGRVNTLIARKLTYGGTGDVQVSDFLSTATVHGRVSPGLMTRRMREFAMFIGNPP